MLGENDGPSMLSYAATGAKFGIGFFLPFVALTFCMAIVVQEMAVRLGAATHRGHAELILDRFGPFLGWFSMIDLCIGNFLTLITEFIAVRAGLGFFGVPPWLAILIALAILYAALMSHRYWTWERVTLAAAATLQTVLELGAFSGIEATEAGLREGVFLERTLLAGREPLFEDVRADAVRNLAVQYESDLPHAEHVAILSLQMHDSLVECGLIEPRPAERELLWSAAMLHDVGMTIAYGDHHKHSLYLIVSAELPGFDPRERALIALISRYHRKGAPKLGELAALARDGDEDLLARCAVILRLAEHLERGRDRSVRSARLRTGGDGIDLHLQAAGDLTLPRWSVERYGDDECFQRVFGRRLLIG